MRALREYQRLPISEPTGNSAAQAGARRSPGLGELVCRRSSLRTSSGRDAVGTLASFVVWCGRRSLSSAS